MPDPSTRRLDVSGQMCPMPIVRTRQALDDLIPGDVLEVVTTDRGALSDIPAWAGRLGHRVLDIADNDSHIVFQLQKG